MMTPWMSQPSPLDLLGVSLREESDLDIRDQIIAENMADNGDTGKVETRQEF